MTHANFFISIVLGLLAVFVGTQVVSFCLSFYFGMLEAIHASPGLNWPASLIATAFTIYVLWRQFMPANKESV